METIYLDTHVLIWLAEGNTRIFSERASQAIEENTLSYSSIVHLELSYLFERGKLVIAPEQILLLLENEIGLSRRDSPIGELVTQAVSMSWTRDPFDRLITAQASVVEAPLITKDKVIREHYGSAVW